MSDPTIPQPGEGYPPKPPGYVDGGVQRIPADPASTPPPPQPVQPRPIQQKDVGIAYLFWFFLGVLGAHKFYLGRIGMGVAYLLTLGFLGVGVLIDLFTLPRQVRATNDALYGKAVS